MKAVVYNGPHDVSVNDVADAKIKKPSDVLIKITTTNICGSDLHMYEGRTDMERGRVFGHENLGEVIAVGAAVERIKVGDMVSVPFNVACGTCENCNRRLTNYCLRAQPDPHYVGAAYGFADMGGWQGGQAEFLRVPWGEFNCLVLPEDAKDRESDYALLSDILPTGYHATEMADVRPGESVVIYGGGPVGLMAALSADTRGASQVMVVDRHPDRLALAEKLGAIAIDDSKSSPVHAVMEHTKGLGADKGCECVGYQAHDPQGNEHPEQILDNLISSVRFAGRIGTVGVFIPEDPGAATKMTKQGQVPFGFGNFWFKGQSMGNGQAPVKQYDSYLSSLIHHDKIKPSTIVSHEISLSEAPEAYKSFDARENGWTKVLMHP